MTRIRLISLKTIFENIMIIFSRHSRYKNRFSEKKKITFLPSIFHRCRFESQNIIHFSFQIPKQNCCLGYFFKDAYYKRILKFKINIVVAVA